MKKRSLCLLLTMISIAILLSFFAFQCRYPCIRKGIGMAEAKMCADQQDGYFIVTQNQGCTGTSFLVAYGYEKGIEVELNGNSPRNHLSWVFFNAKPNYFLVRGKERNIENQGKPLMDNMDISDMYTIDVDEWEIIAPIRRDYQYQTHSRWNYPLWCIDSYDVNHHDYTVELTR